LAKLRLMTRILHILDHSLPLHSGYCFRTRAIMKSQIANGLSVAGVTGVRQDQGGYEAQAPLEHEDGLDFYRCLENTRGPTPLKEWREISIFADRILQICRQWQPDILHAHSPVLDGLAALRVSQKLKIPLLYEIRAFWEDAAVGNGTGRQGSPRYWLTRQLENHVVQHADAIAVICEGLKKDLVKRGVADEKITISPNGVDMELFGSPPAPDEALRNTLQMDGKSILGFIGSFYDYEGLDDLIAAMPILRAEIPNLALLLVGGGPREEALRDQVATLGLDDAVHFTGRVPHDEVERYYSLMDIMVYPRKSMRLTDLVTPLKPLEAMAQGRLVAASDVGGHLELIKDGETGTIFPAGDPEGIAKKLSDLLQKREKWAQTIENAKKYVEQERSWAANILRYEPVYQNLLLNGSLEQAA